MCQCSRQIRHSTLITYSTARILNGFLHVFYFPSVIGRTILKIPTEPYLQLTSTDYKLSANWLDSYEAWPRYATDRSWNMWPNSAFLGNGLSAKISLFSEKWCMCPTNFQIMLIKWQNMPTITCEKGSWNSTRNGFFPSYVPFMCYTMHGEG